MFASLRPVAITPLSPHTTALCTPAKTAVLLTFGRTHLTGYYHKATASEYRSRQEYSFE